MRRTWASGRAAVMCLALVGVPAMAQGDEEEVFGATHVTGTVTANRTVQSPTFVEHSDTHFGAYDAVYERDFEWSDPRLPSVMRASENWDYYGVGGSDEISAALSLMLNLRLDGPDGAWTGAIYALAEETGYRYPQTVLMILSGEGAYEGLSAIFKAVYDEAPVQGEEPDWDGYIFEGPLTPMPESDSRCCTRPLVTRAQLSFGKLVRVRTPAPVSPL